MGLSNDLISQFVKTTNDRTKSTKKESTMVYGTVKIRSDGQQCVQIDGSEVSTPVSTAVDVKDGDRVIVTIKNHNAIVTGNLSDPSANSNTINNFNADTGARITELEVAVAKRVTTDTFNATKADVETLKAEKVVIQKSLEASQADIENLKAGTVTISEKLSANEADIKDLQTNKLDVEAAKATYATVENLDATNADIHNLETTYGNFKQATTETLDAQQASIEELDTKKLDAESAKVIYANIDFSNIGEAAVKKILADSGLIENIVVGDGTITGKLVGVTISGDLIEGNTVVAEKLVIKGTDGLYYKLNTDGITTEAEQTDYNSLNGSVIKAKSITATKISVDDLVAFDATIGGFNITEKSLYSGVKSSVDNTTNGIYLDKDGQMAIGGSNNFIKYYKDQNGAYKLAISADSIIFASSNKSVETAISEVQTAASKAQQTADNITIGGRNLLPNTVFNDASKYYERTEDKNTEGGFHFYPMVQIESGVEYTISAYIRGNANIVFYEINEGGNLSHWWIKRSELSETEYKLYSLTFIVRDDRIFKNVYICTQWGEGNTLVGDWFEIKQKSLKLEKGNKPTDWTPAPEDMATSEEVDRAQTTADEANDTATNAESLIAQLRDSISMLVTDGNGTSLMTQTEDGWTFSTAGIQSLVNDVSDGLASLKDNVGDVDNTVNIIRQAVDDLGVIADYVKITTYDNEPCIELGEGDSEFKLRITNTRMMFTEGSTVLAYFNNKSLHIKKAVVEEELQQGNFVWKARSNGNLGIVWKGGTN